MAMASTWSAIPATKSLAASRSTGQFAAPRMVWPPWIWTTCSTGTLSLYSSPAIMRATRQPLPSTTELVARVDDRDTSRISLSGTSPMFEIDSDIPMLRSFLEVRALALASTFPVESSTNAVSVYVPPVSIPNPRSMICLPSASER
ncbi:hypothetical protein DSECCO2_582100 [anaerobic digester metagenome]